MKVYGYCFSDGYGTLSYGKRLTARQIQSLERQHGRLVEWGQV